MRVDLPVDHMMVRRPVVDTLAGLLVVHTTERQLAGRTLVDSLVDPHT
jgi:hypothetical protein